MLFKSASRIKIKLIQLCAMVCIIQEVKPTVLSFFLISGSVIYSENIIWKLRICESAGFHIKFPFSQTHIHLWHTCICYPRFAQAKNWTTVSNSSWNQMKHGVEYAFMSTADAEYNRGCFGQWFWSGLMLLSQPFLFLIHRILFPKQYRL